MLWSRTSANYNPGMNAPALQNGALSFHDEAALEKLRSELGIDPQCLRSLRNAFYKKHLPADDCLQALPEEQRAIFKARLSFHTLALERRHDSRLDRASKLVFRTAQGHLLESVILRPATGRTSLCVSSQVGCAVRCQFCATGQMGAAVNLSRDEIVDQISQANRLLRLEGRPVRNVVFMGMGEPFHNEAAVYAALDLILSKRCFNLSPAHVTVSTVGIPEAMVRCARRFPQLRIAVSLHSANQEGRERLIPLARRFPLDSLRSAIEAVTSIQGQPVMIEYLLLEGVNDTDQDLAEFISCLRGVPVHVNLIPYNPIDDASGLHATPAARRTQFAARLKGAGFPVTMRHSFGADIAAACGQLVRREESKGRP